MTHQTTRKLVMSALFAAIIYLSVTFLKINLAPKTMVHLGNAVVVLSYFALGKKYSVLAASMGLAIFDLLNNFADSLIFTVSESILVILVIDAVFKALHQKETLVTITTVGVTAGIVKIIVIFIRRYITFVLLSGAATALPLTIARMTNTFITSLFTAAAVPILYFALKPVLLQIKAIISK